MSKTLRRHLGRGLRCAIVLSIMSCRPRSPSDWAEVKAWVRSEFPGVEHVSAEELKAYPGPPVLLDVRTEEEYRVSHIEGALRVEPGKELPDFLKTLDRETPVVAYCSVGYRSSQLVERLEKEGFEDVKNLEGSIFEWANEGYAVLRDGRPVKEVHPYDEKWGRLLHPELHAYRPKGEPPK